MSSSGSQDYGQSANVFLVAAAGGGGPGWRLGWFMDHVAPPPRPLPSPTSVVPPPDTSRRQRGRRVRETPTAPRCPPPRRFRSRAANFQPKGPLAALSEGNECWPVPSMFILSLDITRAVMSRRISQPDLLILNKHLRPAYGLCPPNLEIWQLYSPHGAVGAGCRRRQSALECPGVGAAGGAVTESAGRTGSGGGVARGECDV